MKGSAADRKSSELLSLPVMIHLVKQYRKKDRHDRCEDTRFSIPIQNVLLMYLKKCFIREKEFKFIKSYKFGCEKSGTGLVVLECHDPAAERQIVKDKTIDHKYGGPDNQNPLTYKIFLVIRTIFALLLDFSLDLFLTHFSILFF